MGVSTGLAILTAALAVLLLAAWVRERRRGAVLVRRLESAQAGSAVLVRLVRLTAGDLRAPALGLLGHAEQVPAPLKDSLVGVCRYLLDLADALLEQTEQPETGRILREEEVKLGPLLAFVMAQIAAHLGPGRRAWRIAPGLDGVALLADRRALHQVLLRVLSAAALATTDGDWIDITGVGGSGTWTLQVEDEGAGLPVSKMDAAGVETRGLGVGLALARSLMQAHGGALAIESTARVGTRALLRFPSSRVLAGT
jgi:signal transduction histidine kinase